jgi:hypothetical protein
MRKTVYILLFAFIVSVAINIRLFYVFKDSHDDLYEVMSDSLKIEDEALKNLENNNINEAKEILSTAIGEKALIIGICIESKCVSEKTIRKISRKYDE